jgi:hypothetical protein
LDRNTGSVVTVLGGVGRYNIRGGLRLFITWMYRLVLAKEL